MEAQFLEAKIGGVGWRQQWKQQIRNAWVWAPSHPKLCNLVVGTVTEPTDLHHFGAWQNWLAALCLPVWSDVLIFQTFIDNLCLCPSIRIRSFFYLIWSQLLPHLIFSILCHLTVLILFVCPNLSFLVGYLTFPSLYFTTFSHPILFHSFSLTVRVVPFLGSPFLILSELIKLRITLPDLIILTFFLSCPSLHPNLKPPVCGRWKNSLKNICQTTIHIHRAARLLDYLWVHFVGWGRGFLLTWIMCIWYDIRYTVYVYMNTHIYILYAYNIYIYN